MASTLMVKCKGCYEEFEAPEQMDQAGLAAARMPTTMIQCPHCRIRRPYDKGDFYFR